MKATRYSTQLPSGEKACLLDAQLNISHTIITTFITYFANPTDIDDVQFQLRQLSELQRDSSRLIVLGYVANEPDLILTAIDRMNLYRSGDASREFVFYRGFELLNSTTIDTGSNSDADMHLAVFRVH